MALPRYLVRGLGLVSAFLALAPLFGSNKAEPGPKKAATPEQAVEFLASASKAGDVQAALGQMAQPFHDIMLWFVLNEDAEDTLRAALERRFGKQRTEGFRMEVKQDLIRIQRIQVLARRVKSDTRVELTVRETARSFQRDGSDVIETSYLALKENGVWKVLRPFTALVFGASEKEMTQERAVEKGPGGEQVLIFRLTFKKPLDEFGRDLQRALEKREGKKLHQVLEEARRQRAAAEKLAGEIAGGKYTTRNEAMEAFRSAQRRLEHAGPRPH
jgi:hypothetical protein